MYLFLEMRNFDQKERFSEDQRNILEAVRCELLQVYGFEEWNDAFTWIGVMHRGVPESNANEFVDMIIRQLRKYSFILGPVYNWTRFQIYKSLPTCPNCPVVLEYDLDQMYCSYCGSKNSEAVKFDPIEIA
jgi:hypothetical protein